MDLKAIEDNLQDVRRRVAAAEDRRTQITGRPHRSVRLVAVSKLQSIEAIVAAYGCGQRVFGENYIQELCVKCSDEELIIETIDSYKLAKTLETALASTQHMLQVMVQINTSAEDNKNGINVSEVLPLIMKIRDECPHLKVVGLMTIGRFGHDPSDGPNPDFAALVSCRQMVCESLGADTDTDSMELSFGMTADFEEAITMGSTEVRVGTAVFGHRLKKV